MISHRYICLDMYVYPMYEWMFICKYACRLLYLIPDAVQKHA